MTRLVFATVFTCALAACSGSDKPAAPITPTQPATSSSAGSVATAVNPARPSEIPSALKDTQDCSVDLVNDAVAVDVMPVADKSKVHLSGWAADAKKGSLPKSAFLEIAGGKQAYAPVVLGQTRADVATHFSKPALGNAGWKAVLDLSSLPAGNYSLRVIQLGDTASTICETHKAVKLN